MLTALQQTPKAFLSGGGSPGRLLAANGFNLRVLRPYKKGRREHGFNAILRKDEWLALDDAVVKVGRVQLNGIEDLRMYGLTRNLGSLGVLYDQYEQQSDISGAEQSMTGRPKGDTDLIDHDLVSVPIPITFKDWEINLRLLEASRRGNTPIDTAMAELATRVVSEMLEDTLFNGSSVNPGGNALYGYTNHPNRITGSLTGDGWDAANGDIIGDVIAMIAAAEAQNFRGPWVIYVPVAYMAELRADYSANKGDRTFLERILAIEEIQAVKSSASLTGDEVVMVQMTRDVVDLSIASDITTVQWSTAGGFIENYRVMAAMAPRIKSPYGASAKTGVVHFT